MRGGRTVWRVVVARRLGIARQEASTTSEERAGKEGEERPPHVRQLAAVAVVHDRWVTARMEWWTSSLTHADVPTTRSEHDFEPTDNLESSRHAVARLNDRAVRRQGHNVPKSSLSDLCASCRRVWQVLRRPSIGSSPIDRSEDKQEGILLMTRDWT